MADEDVFDVCGVAVAPTLLDTTPSARSVSASSSSNATVELEASMAKLRELTW